MYRYDYNTIIRYTPYADYIYNIAVGNNIIDSKENSIIISQCVLKKFTSYTITELVLNLKV